MKKLPAILVLSFAIALSAPATKIDGCPPYIGTFNVAETGLLTVTIVKQDDKAVAPHTERLANPLRGKDAEALVRRGAVQFNAHAGKDSGRLFVHWESLR